MVVTIPLMLDFYCQTWEGKNKGENSWKRLLSSHYISHAVFFSRGKGISLGKGIVRNSFHAMRDGDILVKRVCQWCPMMWLFDYRDFLKLKQIFWVKAGKEIDSCARCKWWTVLLGACELIRLSNMPCCQHIFLFDDRFPCFHQILTWDSDTVNWRGPLNLEHDVIL